jgi:hypothetical protein
MFSPRYSLIFSQMPMSWYCGLPEASLPPSSRRTNADQRFGDGDHGMLAAGDAVFERGQEAVGAVERERDLRDKTEVDLLAGEVDPAAMNQRRGPSASRAMLLVRLRFDMRSCR